MEIDFEKNLTAVSLNVDDLTAIVVSTLLAAYAVRSLSKIIKAFWKKGRIKWVKQWGMTRWIFIHVNNLILTYFLLYAAKPIAEMLNILGHSGYKAMYTPVYIFITIDLWVTLWLMRRIIWSRADTDISAEDHWSKITGAMADRHVKVSHIIAGPFIVAAASYGPSIIRNWIGTVS